MAVPNIDIEQLLTNPLFDILEDRFVQYVLSMLQGHRQAFQMAFARWVDVHEFVSPNAITSTADLPPGYISRQLLENAQQKLDSWLDKHCIFRATYFFVSQTSSGPFFESISPYASWRKGRISCENLWVKALQMRKECDARKTFEPFVHHPLRYPDSIRLLEIHDSSSQSLIRCSLQEFRLSKIPPYTALSYVWKDYGPIWNDHMSGEKKPDLDADEERTIVCNGKQLQIGASLFAAISGLRDELNGQLIWIDAICIDQRNEREKSSQVARIADIYSGAYFVFIWLGRRLNGRDKALIGLENLPVWPKSAADLSIDFQGRRFSSPQELLVGSTSTLLHMVTSTVMFLLDGWFQRVWTVQEFVHAKDFGFYYNGYQIQSHYLENALSWLQFLLEKNQMPTLDASPWWYRRAYPIFELRARIQRGELLDLSESVLVSSPKISSMPQDRVYAVLSLTEPSSLKVLGISGGNEDTLVPDYGKPLEDVFIDLARRLLHGKMGLSMLSLVRNAEEARPRGKQHTEYDPSKPPDFDIHPERYLYEYEKKWLTETWPDLEGFRMDAFPSWVPKLTTVPGTQPNHLTGSAMFSAASSIDPSFVVSRDGRTLTALAMVVDTVKFQVAVAGIDTTLDLPHSYFWPKIEHYFLGKLGPDRTYEYTGERILTALWRTLLDDMWNGRHPAPSHLESDFIRWLAKESSAPNSVRRELGLSYDPQPEQSATLFGSALMSTTARSRAFFVTEKGYYGLGPRTVGRGDSVMVLPGAQVPYLFRPHLVKEGSWMLIGETYVHGIMHGEALRSELGFRMIDVV